MSFLSKSAEWKNKLSATWCLASMMIKPLNDKFENNKASMLYTADLNCSRCTSYGI